MSTTDPTTLASLINKYGPYTVILSVVLILFIYMVRLSNKSLKKFEEESIKNNEAYKNSMAEITKKMIDQLVILSNAQKPAINTNETSLMTTFSKLKAAMQDDCKESMNSVKADRLAIYLFHNGAHSTHGIKFFKVSCICECVKIGCGIREHSIDHSNVPLNLFDNMISDLSNNGYYVIKNDDQLVNSNHRIFVSGEKIKYSIAISIFDSNNNILGFILAEFPSEYTDEEMSNQLITLKSLVSKLTPILSFSDYVEFNINKINKEN